MPRFARLLAERENWPIAAAFAACFAFLIWKSLFLHYPDLAFRYPFMQFDSFQWILDSFYYRGHDISTVFRDPGLPLLIALLGRLGIQSWLPELTVALLGMYFLYLVLLLRRSFGPVPVAIAVLLLFFDFSMQTSFDQILADQWAVTLQLAAVYHLVEAQDDPGHLIPFAIWAAVSFLFQYAIAALAPVFLIFALRGRGRPGFGRMLASAFAVAVAIPAPIFIYKEIHFGNPLHSGVIQFPLLGLHFFGLAFYAFNFFSFFGVVTASIMIYGFVRGLRNGGQDLLINGCILGYGAFWILFYSWLDPRFLLYLAPFAGYCLARGLQDLNVAAWLGPPKIRAAVGWCALAFALSCSLYGKPDPYTRNELPVGPRTELVLGMCPITGWQGNVTISLSGMHLAEAAEPFPAISFLASYYPRHMRSIDPRLAGEAADLERLRIELPPGESPIAGCDRVADDYFAKMRLQIALQRRVQACEPSVRLRLQPADAAVAPGEQVLFGGKYFRLLRRKAPMRHL